MADMAGYVRVSTEQQKAEGSHERQRADLEAWADENDHALTLYEDIAISGQADERPDYDALMDEAEQYDAVVVRELSRFGRSLRRVLNDIHGLAERDVGFITLDHSLDTTTAQGKLMLQIIGAFNEFWANTARERAQAEVERRREAGEPIGRPKKLDDDQRAEVRAWRDKGLSYRAISVLVDDMWSIDVDQSTIYRYCQESAA